ncbi:hypothetical protein NC651_007536 [Populus alba x Populus x berolinensis]|nr:hypothetical protein NC651_007536 [Populus alba x Populus x berolinensis]
MCGTWFLHPGKGLFECFLFAFNGPIHSDFIYKTNVYFSG